MPRHIAGVHDVQPGIAQRRRAAAGGDQLDALRREELAELHEALLVRHREQRALHLHDIGGLHRVGEARRLMARAQSRAAGDTRHHQRVFQNAAQFAHVAVAVGAGRERERANSVRAGSRQGPAHRGVDDRRADVAQPPVVRHRELALVPE